MNMSANNCIFITKNPEGKFVIREMDIDSWTPYSTDIPVCETLEEAVREANRYSLTTEIEYGLQIAI